MKTTKRKTSNSYSNSIQRESSFLPYKSKRLRFRTSRRKTVTYMKTPSQRVKRIPSLKRFMSPLSILSTIILLVIAFISLSLQTSGLAKPGQEDQRPLSLSLS